MAKKNNSFDITGVLMALGGGVGAGLIMDQLEDKIDMFKDKPMLSPLVVTAAGLSTIYFTNERFAGLGYGMIGAAGSELMEGVRDKMEGFSRVNYVHDPAPINGYQLNADELEELEVYEDDGDGMSDEY